MALSIQTDFVDRARFKLDAGRDYYSLISSPDSE